MSARFVYNIFIGIFFMSCQSDPETTSPVVSSITDAVFASGHIEPVDQFVLTSISEGYLQASWVEENDVIEKDQVLFAIDNSHAAIEEAAAAGNLRLALRNASANSPTLVQLRADLSNAKVKRANDSVQYYRLIRLYENRSISQVELETGRLAYEVGVNQVKSIEENIKAVDISLQQNLISSRQQYESSAVGKKYYGLTGTGRQRVYQVLKKEGELVRKGEAVALLGHPDSLAIILSVDETGISKVRVGQQVLVELNTNSGETMIGEVIKIYPYFDEAKQAYKVEARFTVQPSGIIAGTLLQANIIVSRKQGVMLIPRSFLTPDHKVILERGRKADTLEVRTGIVSTEWVEILEGLTVKDILIKGN